MQHRSTFPLFCRFTTWVSSLMDNDDPYTFPDVASVARDFTALWLAGDYRGAGEKYWDEKVVSIKPYAEADNSDAVCRGIEEVSARNLRWFSTHAIEDLSVDGPFITGNYFALFADMLIVHAGRRTPHSQIVVFAVREGKITEERYFHP